MNNLKGFTLLEMIGVMAVLAILAAALAPNVVQMVDEGYYQAERKSLRTLADGLEQYIASSKQIPAGSAWHTAVADMVALPLSRVEQNDKRYRRQVYFDPRFLTTTDRTWNGYTQTTGLSSPPNSPRIMLVSNLRGEVRANLNSHTAFEAVWQQADGAILQESREVLIQRVNLAPMFVKINQPDSVPSEVYLIVDDRLGLAALEYPDLMGND